jgi:malate permease and related proteins
MKELWPIVASVLAVFLIMGTGAACRSIGWLNSQADRTLASLTSNVMLPAYFVSRFTSDKFDAVALSWLPPTLGFGLTALGFVLAYGLARIFGPWLGLETDSKQRAFALCAGICNYGYIPLPIAESLYPNAVIDLIMHNVGVDLALWSVGLLIMNGLRNAGWRRAVFSPPLIAVVFCMLLKQSGMHHSIPGPMLAAVGQLGSCAIPLGLLLSGAIIVDFLKGSPLVGNVRTILTAIGFRQGLMPVIILGTASMLRTSANLDVVLALQAAMPSAVFPIVIVRLYGQDTDTALRVVLWTGIASLVLIPAWMFVGRCWLQF